MLCRNRATSENSRTMQNLSGMSEFASFVLLLCKESERLCSPRSLLRGFLLLRQNQRGILLMLRLDAFGLPPALPEIP
jgi:hypothetical protein